MLQTGINISSRSNAPFVFITFDYCAFSNWTLIVQLIQEGIIHEHRSNVSPSKTCTPCRMSIRCFRSLHCIPLNILECFLKCHDELSWASILQSFRDTGSLWGSWVQVFSTVKTVSCTGMENIQAIKCLHASIVPGSAGVREEGPC